MRDIGNCYNAFNSGRQASISCVLFDEFGVENYKVEWVEKFFRARAKRTARPVFAQVFWDCDAGESQKSILHAELRVKEILRHPQHGTLPSTVRQLHHDPSMESLEVSTKRITQDGEVGRHQQERAHALRRVVLHSDTG